MVAARPRTDDEAMRHAVRDHRRLIEGDVHVGSMGADVALVPGSTTHAGATGIERQMRRALARVRRNVDRRKWSRRER